VVSARDQPWHECAAEYARGARHEDGHLEACPTTRVTPVISLWLGTGFSICWACCRPIRSAARLLAALSTVGGGGCPHQSAFRQSSEGGVSIRSRDTRAQAANPSWVRASLPG
jgi:hypothetical protein